MCGWLLFLQRVLDIDVGYLAYNCKAWGFERRLIIKGDRNLGVTSCGASCTLQDEQGNILLKMLGMFPGDWHI